MNRELMIDLIEKAKNGDSNALNDLLGQTTNNLYSVLKIAGINDNDALTVIQEILLEISKGINELEEPNAYFCWVQSLLNGNMEKLFENGDDKELLEKNTEEAMIYLSRFSDEEEILPHSITENQGLFQIIHRMIETLPEPQRIAVYLKHYDCHSVAEIAEIQGVSEETVENRLKYARNVLGAAVEYYESKQETKLDPIPFGPFIQWVFSNLQKQISAENGAKITEYLSKETENTFDFSEFVSAEEVVEEVDSNSEEETKAKGKKRKIPLWAKIAVALGVGAVLLGGISVTLIFGSTILVFLIGLFI